MKPEPASFRDPAGQVFFNDDRVFRTIAASALESFEFAQSTEPLKKAIAQGGVVSSTPLTPDEQQTLGAEAALVVEHPRLPFLSYPYEWSFSLLKAAALHHLDLQLALLPSGVSLSDATAYNIQFQGVRPIFIDALSFQRYEDGDYWTAHRQFCEQFLNPLLLHALFGIPHSEWYRGAMEGVSTPALAKLIPFHKRFSWRLQTHILMPARFDDPSREVDVDQVKKSLRKPLPRHAYLGMLQQLRDWISGMTPKHAKKTVWSDYADNNSYDDEEAQKKKSFIAQFTDKLKPELLWDLGCNTGAYSETALQNGAKRVIGFDYDHGALEGAYARAKARNLDFLPLFQDAANPSPGQGWRNLERSGLTTRSEQADGVIALAFTHHLAIGRNIPLDQLADWLCGLAPSGVIEFTPKNDSMVQRLLALRDDIFPDYDLDTFKGHIGRQARIVRVEQVTQSGRALIHYDRT